MATDPNPFAQNNKRLVLKQNMQRGALMAVTYTILCFTLFVFGLIVWRGAPVLKQYGWEFIKRKPESLEVVTFDAAKKLEIPADRVDTLLTYNPKEGLFTDFSDTAHSSDYRTFRIEPGSVIGDGYLTNIEVYNDFSAQFAKRDMTAPVGFEFPEETTLQLQPDTYAALIAAAPSFSPFPHEQRTLEKQSYRVEFERKECQMQAKTIVALSRSLLIYKLYGNLTDTADDKPDELMPLLIPEAQSVLLTPSEYSAYQSDTGDAKFGEGTPIVTNYDLTTITIPAGHYVLPLQMLATLLKESPSASALHSHDLDRGAIHLALKDTTDEFLLPVTEFDQLQKDNPQLTLSDLGTLSHETAYKQFTLTQAAQLKLPTTDMTALRVANAGAVNENGQPRLKSLGEEVYPYTAGGIAGPIIGTAALVLTCMAIGLAIGVCASIYLGEYSRKGKLISAIRLSMMNLAGVPSIVFGIFGLGLFVSVAPKMTSTPAIDDKLRFPVFPSFSEPDLRTQEQQGIMMIDPERELIYQLRSAQQQGQERYYTGWTYLSFQGWGNSLIAGAFTLAIMVLPIIITSSEESLRAVPQGFREASLALGASKWQSIKTAVLPYATPGILTASVLGITRVAGETAPIMFTAAVAAKSDLPTDFSALPGVGLEKFFAFLSQSVQAMPYHIYTIAGRLPPSYHIKPMQYGSVLVFMIIVMIFAGLSVWLRIRMRKKYKW